MIKTPNDVVFQRRTQEELKNWGESDWEIIKRQLKNKRTCLDIGAHNGLTTLRFAEHFEHVHSFEPILGDYLQENTKQFNNVTLYFNAVTDKEQELEMFTNPHNSGCGMVNYSDMERLLNSRYFKENARFEDIATPIKVKGITIDSLNLTDVDLIKIDVEGYNIPVLNGMIETLKNNSPIIQIENHPENPGVMTQSNKILTDLGYIHYYQTRNKPQDWFYYKA